MSLCPSFLLRLDIWLHNTHTKNNSKAHSTTQQRGSADLSLEQSKNRIVKIQPEEEGVTRWSPKSSRWGLTRWRTPHFFFDFVQDHNEEDFWLCPFAHTFPAGAKPASWSSTTVSNPYLPLLKWKLAPASYGFRIFNLPATAGKIVISSALTLLHFQAHLPREVTPGSG